MSTPKTLRGSHSFLGCRTSFQVAVHFAAPTPFICDSWRKKIRSLFWIGLALTCKVVRRSSSKEARVYNDGTCPRSKPTDFESGNMRLSHVWYFCARGSGVITLFQVEPASAEIQRSRSTRSPTPGTMPAAVHQYRSCWEKLPCTANRDGRPKVCKHRVSFRKN